MRILMVGDVIGRPGRAAFAKYTAKIKKERGIDLVVVNGENVANGKGMTRDTLQELFGSGADIVTSGNHIWDKKDVFDFIDDEPYLVRPANYPEGAPGRGWCAYEMRSKMVGVMNLAGRTFMPQMDCPFQKAEDLLREMTRTCDIILLDFHAETTSEKIAMGWYLDGRVQAVVGTHTHVPTADACILPGGTAYITDLGMVGPWHSVIGVDTETVIKKFVTGLPARFEVPNNSPCIYAGVVLEIDNKTNHATSIEQIVIREDDATKRS